MEIELKKTEKILIQMLILLIKKSKNNIPILFISILFIPFFQPEFFNHNLFQKSLEKKYGYFQKFWFDSQNFLTNLKFMHNIRFQIHQQIIISLNLTKKKICFYLEWILIYNIKIYLQMKHHILLLINLFY